MTTEKSGKYDTECEQLLRTTKAAAACVIILGGEKGSGFSVSSRTQPDMGALVSVLENVVAQMRVELQTARKNGDDEQ